MSIQSYITELEAINAEIRRNNDSNRKLRVRSKVVENHITGYLDSTNREGVKFKGKKFMLEEKVSHKRRGKKAKEEETMRLLSDMGISNTREAYTKIMNAQKGEEVETRKLKIHKDNKKKDIY